MNTSLSVSSLCTCLTLLATSAWAFPATLSVQGRLLVGDSVVPPDGAYGMELALYDVATGGQALFTEAHAAVAVADGAFSLLLGGANPVVNPLPSPLFAAAPALWLGVRVAGEPELPRGPLSAVAWAFYADSARSAATANTLTCSGCVDVGHIAPSVLAPYARVDSLHPIATSGAYDDLLGRPALGVVFDGTGTLAPGETLTVSHNRNTLAALAVGWLQRGDEWVQIDGAVSRVGLAADPAHLLHWSFDDCTGKDTTPNGYPGTLVGGPPCVPGKTGTALSFDGSSFHNVTRQLDTTLATLTDAHTFALWVKRNAAPPKSSVFLSYDNGSNIMVASISPAGSVTVGWPGGGANDVGALVDGTWNHIAITFDGATQRIYLNAQLQYTGARAKLPIGVGNCLMIGEDADGNCLGGGDNDGFHGLIDDVHAFNRALSSAEIEELMEGGAALTAAEVRLTGPNAAALTNRSAEAGTYRLVVVAP